MLKEGIWCWGFAKCDNDEGDVRCDKGRRIRGSIELNDCWHKGS
jgi:hypothetical protein